MGAGKSFAANILRDLGLPVFDADAVIHANWPAPEVQNGLQQLLAVSTFVQRADVKTWLGFDSKKLAQLEAVLYPHLNEAMQNFLVQHKNAACVALDVPLLFEKNWHTRCHTTICLVAPTLLCQWRILKRPHTSKKFYKFLQQQHWPQAKKAKAANYSISSLWGKIYVTWRLNFLLKKLL
jgi:dephospho-CoA kinase